MKQKQLEGISVISHYLLILMPLHPCIVLFLPIGDKQSIYGDLSFCISQKHDGIHDYTEKKWFALQMEL